MNPVVQIQARLGSTRLPGKVLYHLGPRRVIDWVVERCDRARLRDHTVLSIGDRPENDAVHEWCSRTDVDCHSGPEGNLLLRHLRTAERFDSDPVIRITGDCPFVPPSEIDRVVSEHEHNDARYTTNVTEGMPTGTAVDVIDRDVLVELHERGATHPVRRLRDAPDEWGAAFTSASPWVNFSDAHTAVDTPTDYWTLVDAVTAVGGDPLDVTEWVAEGV